MIDFTTTDAIKKSGFAGFVTAQALRNARCEIVPRSAGVYLALWPTHELPEFLTRSPAGWFKGQDPTISARLLAERWVAASNALYIGKASSLRRRLREYLKFGEGKPAGHKGGRFIWQVENSDEVLFCWKEIFDEDPRTVEAALIRSFRSRYRKMPFANIQS